MGTGPCRAAAAAIVVLLLGSPLPAYLVRRTVDGGSVRWDLGRSAPNVVAGKVTFHVDEASAQDVTGPQFGAAVRAAVASWEDGAISSIAFREDPARPASRKDASDRVNRFGFSSGILPPFAFAAAFTAIQGSRIIDVDVVYNPEMTWAVQTPGHPSKADVEGVTAHEWGHGIGLDHVPLFRSTMYYSSAFGQLSLRSLENDDHAGAASSYPAADLDAACGRIRGRVDVAGTSDERGIQVTAIDVSTGFPAAASMTGPSGEYEILGLPPGVFRLVASPMGRAKIDGGVYSPWWDSAATGILPAVRGQGGAADGSTGAHVLAAGQVLEGMDLAVAAASAPGEPNETTGTARPTALGRSVAARIEGSNDNDVWSFAGTAGRTVSLFVHARQIGSDLDPRLYLRGPNGVVLAVNDDIASDDLAVSGADTDCRILGYVLPATGTYFAEVEAAEAVDADRIEDFSYVLVLLEGGAGSASPHTSEMTASPAVVPADGVSQSLVTFRPLTLQATEIGPGRAVSFELAADGDADGQAGPAVDHGDGTYSVSLAAPSSPGSDVVRAKVDGAEVSTVVVSWRGPADFAASAFAAEPRRIRPDGAATSVLTLVPRDANGIPLGAGRTVVLSLAGSPAADLAPAIDGGDGSYAAVLTAGAAEEDLAVEAEVDGEVLGGAWSAAVGFPLGPVLEDAAGDLAAALGADPAPPARAAPRLEKARALLAAAPSADAPAAVAAIRRALLHLDAAGRGGIDAAALSRELAEAVRQAAGAAMDLAEPLSDTAREASLLAKAAEAFARGDELLAAGLPSKAAAKHAAALRNALRVR